MRPQGVGVWGHRWILAPFLVLTQQRPRDRHEQARGGNSPGRPPPLGPGSGQRVGPGILRRNGSGGWGPPGEEASLGRGAPSSLARLGRWDCHRGRCGVLGRGGSLHFLTAALAPKKQGQALPRPWLVPAGHSHPGPAHSRGGFGFCRRGHNACTRQENPAWPSVPRGQGSHGWFGVVTTGLERPLLPQASSSSWVLPSRATLVPEGGQLGGGTFLLLQSWDPWVLPCPGC